MFTEILVEFVKLAILVGIFLTAFGLGFHILLSKNEQVLSERFQWRPENLFNRLNVSTVQYNINLDFIFN